MTAGPADVVVVGASISGLVTSLALARRGITVHLADADPAVGVGVPAGAGEPRRATPQAGHSHAFLARFRELLRAEAPDVLDDLQAAGCRELALTAQRPATVPVHAAHPGDADLMVLAARRTTFEAVLRAAAVRRPEVRLVAGARAAGLVVDAGDAGAGAVPHVRGVAFDDGTEVRARLVVDASGRRTPMPAWLAAHGVELADESSECGIAYLTRFYRREPDAPDLPLDRGFAAGGSFDRYSCLVFPGDGDTFSVTFGVLPEDRSLRGLRDGAAFDAAVRSIPGLAPWIDATYSEPISEVRTMSGLLNRIRRVAHGGLPPAVLGWTAVGDAAATTNPAHSRGCTLGAVHAVGVADAVAEHRDPADLAEACAAVLEADQAPWVADSIEQDHQRLARWRPTSDAADLPPAPAGGIRLSNGETYAAARHDAYVWRRFTRLQQLLDRPDDVLADPRVVARVRAVQAARLSTPALDGPTHDELVELIAAGSAVA